MPSEGGTTLATFTRLAAVVLNYRTVDDTILAVRALQRSTRPVDEVIVVDNGSADGSAERLRALAPAVTLIEAEANLGFAGGNNLGIRAALEHEAGLILLVNSDAIVEPECVEALEHTLHDHADAGIAGPLLLAADDSVRITSAGIRFSPVTGRVREHRSGMIGATPRTVDAVSGAVMLIKRAVFEHIGLLDEPYFFSFEDVDFCLRARARGFGTVCVFGATARHTGSLSIGRHSTKRLYFATRNHLRLASRVAPTAWRLCSVARAGAILTLNLSFAMLRAEAPRSRAVGAVIRGAWDHARGRYGAGPAGPG